MSKQTVYLVIRSDKSVRAVKRLRLADDEIAIPIRLSFPDTWGRINGSTLDVTVPDFAPAVEVGDQAHSGEPESIGTGPLSDEDEADGELMNRTPSAS